MVAPATPGMTNGGTGTRQTIDGFPIVIFHNDGQNTSFIGKYNFNNDKGTSEVYGFDEGDESWEIKNNTSNRVRFKSADFTGDDWKEDFEGSYPEDNTDITRLSAMCAWVASTDGNVEKFRNELEDWFNLENCLAYYLFTEAFLMVDSRAKNAFPTYWASADKWYWRLYDADTAIGINNEGSLAFSYELEDTDTTGSGADVFNGQDSVFWNNLRVAFSSEIQSKWQSWRSVGTMSYDIVESMFEVHQSKWPEAIFNEDAYFKYIQPLIDDGDGTYLPMAQGSKTEQRKWWLYNRFRYMDSKYSAGDSLTDYIQLRGYAKDNITITPYAHTYAAVRFAQTLVKQRALRGQSYLIECPLDAVNDTEIYIYDASRLASVGDLSGLKVGLADFSRAVKLQEIKLGDARPSYSNGNLTNLTLGNNTLLKVLDVRNCSGLTQAVDISGCINIEEIYFDGTAITGLNLPNGGVITKLHLPDTIANLTVLNQNHITEFVLNNYSSITTLWVENSSIDELPILLGMAENGRVRLIGVNWETETYEEAVTLIEKLDKSRGQDAYGNNTQKAQVSGTYHAGVISDFTLELLQTNYPDLIITYDEITPHQWLLNQYIVNQNHDYVNETATALTEYALNRQYGNIYLPNVTRVDRYSLQRFNTDFSLRTVLPNLQTLNGPGIFRYSALSAIDSTSITTASAPPVRDNWTHTFSSMPNLKYIYLPNIEPVTGDFRYMTDGSSNIEYIVAPKAYAEFLPCSCAKLKFVDIFGGNLISNYRFRYDVGENNVLRHFVLRKSSSIVSMPNLPTQGQNPTTGYPEGAVLNIYVPRSLVSQYESATNWSTILAQGRIDFKALEDYTVDGTITGEFNYDLIGMEVYHHNGN